MSDQPELDDTNSYIDNEGVRVPRKRPVSTGLRHDRYVNAEVEVGLPVRIFLYTLDQVATILSISEDHLIKTYIYFDGRSVGPKKRSLILARNIAPTPDHKPEWRVAERELVRYLRIHGFRFHVRGWATH